MHERPGDIFTFYKQGNPSIQLCLTDILAKAKTRNMPELEARIQFGIDQCLTVQRLEYDWNKHRKSGPVSRPEAAETRIQIDHTLKSLNSIIVSHAEVKKDSTQRQAARRLQKALFPTGIQAITGLKYEERSIALQELGQRLTSSFEEDIKTIGATNLVDELIELNELFTEQISVHDDRISFAQVEKAREAAEDTYHIILTLVLAATVDDMDDRKLFLSAVTDQQERLAIEKKTVKAKSDNKDASTNPKDTTTTGNGEKLIDDESTRNTVANIIDGAEKAADKATELAKKDDPGTPKTQSADSSSTNSSRISDDSSCSD